MIKTYKYISLAVLAFGLAACTQEEDFTPQGNQKGAPLAIASAGVANLTTRATITTTEGKDYLTGGSIGVFVKSENTDTRYKGDNLEWNYDGSWKASSATVLYEADGTKQTIGAYYPYTEELTEGTRAIELPETFDSNYEAYDYLYADYVAVSANPINIQMNHLFSKVTVSITSQGSEIGTDAVKSVSLSDVPRTAAWTVPTATLDGYGTADQVSKLYANDTDNDETVDNYVGYALPNAATTLSIHVEMASGRIFAAKATVSGGMTGGNHYLISMKLGKDAVTVGDVTIGEWGTPTENVSGDQSTEIFIRSEVSGKTAVINIVSGATEGVQKAITELLETNTSVTTLTVIGEPTAAQQGALAAALADFNGTLIMDMTDAADAIDNLNCPKQLGGYTYDETNNIYTVYTEAGLNIWQAAVANNNATSLTLGADILLPTRNISVDENGRPSGSNWKTVSSFNGTIDGNGNSIVNLRTYGSAASFIKYCQTSAVVKNLTFLTPVVYQSDPYLGVIAGLFSGTLIENCHVVGGYVTGTGYYGVGGLIGLTNSGNPKIFASTNSANVKGNQHVGGIVGSSTNYTNAAIVACVNTGKVSGEGDVGGIFGCAYYNDVVGCYTTIGVVIGDEEECTGCYYVATEEMDDEEGTTAVADAAALNSEDVVKAMNKAIDTYNNENSSDKVNYKWKVGTTFPELEVTE